MGAVDSKLQAGAWCALGVPISRVLPRNGKDDSEPEKEHAAGEEYTRARDIFGDLHVGLDGFDIQCSTLESVIARTSEERTQTICTSMRLKCDILSLPHTVDERGMTSVRAVHLAEMMAEEYSEREIGEMCEAITRAHQARKQTVLNDVLACATSKLSTGTYHDAPHVSTGHNHTANECWETEPLCAWLSTLFTFRQNSYFEENNALCEEMLAKLRQTAHSTPKSASESLAKDAGEVGGSENEEPTVSTIDREKFYAAFEYWREAQVCELAQGMPHYVEYGEDDEAPSFEQTEQLCPKDQRTEAAIARCRQYFDVLASEEASRGDIEDSQHADKNNVDHMTARRTQGEPRRINQTGVAKLLRACGLTLTDADIAFLCDSTSSGTYTLPDCEQMIYDWSKTSNDEHSVTLLNPAEQSKDAAIGRIDMCRVIQVLESKTDHNESSSATRQEGRISADQLQDALCNRGEKLITKEMSALLKIVQVDTDGFVKLADLAKLIARV